MTHLNNPRNAKLVLLLVALGALTVFGSGSSRADEPVSSTRPLVATAGVIQACCLNDECQILVVLQCIQLGGIPTGAASCDEPESPCQEAACCQESGCTELTPEDCLAVGGGPGPPGSTCPADDVCFTCIGDSDGDAEVGIIDFLQVLADWGPCGSCPGDIDGSGEVGIGDFLIVLVAWGRC